MDSSTFAIICWALYWACMMGWRDRFAEETQYRHPDEPKRSGL
jgi:hypothetical protein